MKKRAKTDIIKEVNNLSVFTQKTTIFTAILYSVGWTEVIMSIRFENEGKLIILETENTKYVMQIDFDKYGPHNPFTKMLTRFSR